MAFAITDLGGGNGFVYIVANNGTDIISNVDNTSEFRDSILKFATGSAPITASDETTQGTYGYRFFGNTTGSEGSLTGAVEISRFIISRAANAARFAVSATIATGVVTTNRVSNDMKLTVDTEGGAASDDLDTITSTGVVDNDIITIVGASAARIVTVKHGTGNIYLTDSTDYATSNGQAQLQLRRMSFAGVTGFYEVTRSSQQPTVTRLRANNVAVPVQGVNSTAMGTSGTTTYVPGTDKGYQVITGTPALIGGVVFTTGGTPLDGDEFILDYRATPTLAGQTITIFGITLTTTQAAQKCVVRTKYKTSNTTWYSTLYVNGNAIDFATTTQLATKEASLGNPASDGMVLSSSAAGVREWVTNQANNVLHNDTSNSQTTAVITQEILKTYTMPGDTMSLDGDILHIRAVYQTAANANGKTCAVYFGTTVVGTLTFDMNNDTVIMDIEVSRIGNTTQSAFSKTNVWDTTTATTAVASSGTYTLPTETLSADVDIECRATNGVASAGDIICRSFSVRIFHKQN